LGFDLTIMRLKVRCNQLKLLPAELKQLSKLEQLWVRLFWRICHLVLTVALLSLPETLSDWTRG
jgi:hypothetical protein